MPSNKASFPSAPQAAFLLLAAFLLQYLVGVALYDFRHVLGLTDEQHRTIGMLLADGILIAGVTHLLAMSYRDLVHPSKTSPLATFTFLVPPVLLLLPLAMLLATVLNGVLRAIFPLSSWEEQAFASMAEGTLPAVVATCLIAPVVEEMLFRGILLRGFLNRYPAGAAISYSALFFGAAHLNIYQFFLAFSLGLLLGWLYERSRSLVPCIALHAAFNTTAVVLNTAKLSPEAEDLLAVPLLAWLTAIAAAAVGSVVLRRLLARREAG